MNHQKAKSLIKALGRPGARRYLRSYFANKRLPVDPAVRRLEFGHFFYHESMTSDSPVFHAELFQDFASGVNAADAAPRGGAKTTVGATEITYQICNAIGHFKLVISDTYSQAKDIVDSVRIELESNELLRWVYGDLTTDWHWTSGGFTTANQVRVLARGSNMKVRGLKYLHWRPDFALVDDIENDEAVMNPDRRLKLLNWIKRALMPAMARGGQICLVGTVLHEDSLLNNAIEGREGFGGWRRHRWKALIEHEDGRMESFWPAMFPVETLLRMRDDPTYEGYLGPLAFAQEMQNEAIDDSARIIKREWIYGTDERRLPYSLTEKMERWSAERPPDAKSWVESELKQIIMAVDPNISEKTTADYFAIVVIGVDKAGEIWELDMVRDRIAEIDRQVDLIIDKAIEWKVDKLKIEAVAYQAGLARGVRRRAAERGTHLPVQEVRPDKDKFRRAVIHSANFAGGLVHLRTDHPLFEIFVKEILDFPVGPHDDMLDAYMHAAEDLVKRPVVRTFRQKPTGF